MTDGDELGDLPTQPPAVPTERPDASASPRRQPSASSAQRPQKRSLVLRIVRVLVLLVIAAGVAVLVSLHVTGVQKVGDVTAQVKEAVAAEVGVKTEKVQVQEQRAQLLKNLNERTGECNAAINRLNRSQEEFVAFRDGRSSPGQAPLEGSLRTLLESVRAVKAASASFTTFVESQREALSTHGLDARNANSTFLAALAAVEGLERQFTAARVREYTLDARREWSSAGIDAKPGDEVTIWASGQWKAGPDWKPCGPDGTDETSRFGDYRIFRGSGAKLMALLGRVSSQESEGTGFVVGSYATWTAPSAGTIQFRCNDSGVSNNEGSVSILILVLPPRPL